MVSDYSLLHVVLPPPLTVTLVLYGHDVSASNACRKPPGKFQGISHCLESGHPV